MAFQLTGEELVIQLNKKCSDQVASPKWMLGEGREHGAEALHLDQSIPASFLRGKGNLQ